MKLLARILEKLLGERYGDDEPELDMYLPNRLLAIGMVFSGIGIVLAAAAFLTSNLMFVIGTIIFIPFGISAYLCWKNQSIRMISSGKFEHTTMFGNIHVYNFSDITGLKKNRDSLTLLVAGKRIHIEAMAILSPRLVSAINQALQKT